MDPAEKYLNSMKRYGMILVILLDLEANT